MNHVYFDEADRKYRKDRHLHLPHGPVRALGNLFRAMEGGNKLRVGVPLEP